MKKFLLLAALWSPLLSAAQTFSNASGTLIPNNAVDLMIPVAVSGIGSAIDSTYGLSSVCFNITHTYDANLRIKLQSPDGNVITLVDQKGGNGQNFQNTCLAENGSGGYVMTGIAPFIGSYFPLQSLNVLNNGQDPNGTWYFIITDLFIPLDSGTFNWVNLSFGVNPPPDPAQGSPCSQQNAVACFCPTAGATDCDLLPDITSSYLSIIDDHVETPGSLVVGVATPNIGWGPLEVHGIQSCFCDTVSVPCQTVACPNGNPPTQLVNQRIYHKTGNAMTYWDRAAGTMSYHPSHGHIHVDNWLDYTLRVPTPNPDARTWPIVGSGIKQSFCLINLFDCDTHPGYCVDSLGNTLLRADFQNADFGNVSGCTNDQGIYVGNADEYNSWLNGQGIIIPDACNETYYVVTITDPLNNFLETNEDNNWVAVPITLTQQSPDHFVASGFTYSLNGLQLAVTANAVAPDSVVWMWGDGTSTTSFTSASSHTFPHNGFYLVYCYAYNHCGPVVSTDTIVAFPNVGIKNDDFISTLAVAPNPARENISVLFSLTNHGVVKLELTDRFGKILNTFLEKEFEYGKYRYSFVPAELNLEAGFYFIRLSGASQSVTKKIVILK